MFRAILCSSSGRQNCISTASGIFTLYERPCSAPVESGLLCFPSGQEIFICLFGITVNPIQCTEGQQQKNDNYKKKVNF
jgi:hypothetical protein